MGPRSAALLILHRQAGAAVPAMNVRTLIAFGDPAQCRTRAAGVARGDGWPDCGDVCGACGSPGFILAAILFARRRTSTGWACSSPPSALGLVLVPQALRDLLGALSKRSSRADPKSASRWRTRRWNDDPPPSPTSHPEEIVGTLRHEIDEAAAEERCRTGPAKAASPFGASFPAPRSERERGDIEDGGHVAAQCRFAVGRRRSSGRNRRWPVAAGSTRSWLYGNQVQYRHARADRSRSSDHMHRKLPFAFSFTIQARASRVKRQCYTLAIRSRTGARKRRSDGTLAMHLPIRAGAWWPEPPLQGAVAREKPEDPASSAAASLAYKSCELVRLIRKAGGCWSTCVLPMAASNSRTPMALAALSENKVYTSLFDLKDEVEMGHIQLSREADLVVVCARLADLSWPRWPPGSPTTWRPR